jgi:DNA topoisomerase-3
MNTRRGATPVHEFHGNFRGISNCFFKVTAVIGHVYGTDFAPGHDRTVDPRSLFDAGVEKKESNEKAHIPRHLKNEASGCDVLILWLDCDREGENICFEVMENTRKTMKHPHEVYRAKFSAVTPKDIQVAMQSLGYPNKNEALAVDARQEIDLKVGVAFTRFQTAFYHYKYGNLDSNVVSYGPCQTPTLGFCVDRSDAINNFKPEPFYVVVPTVEIGGVKMKLGWGRQRIVRDRGLATHYLNQCMHATSTKLLTLATSKKSKPRPIGLNTVTLLKICSKNLGIGPQRAMSAAEHLYLSGFISYPRTESTSYPASFDFAEVLHQQKSHSVWGQHARMLLEDGFAAPKKGQDAGDHPPITPTRKAEETDLMGTEWRVYEFVVRYFLGTISGDQVIQKTMATFDVAGEKFEWKGKVSITDGFTAVMPWMKVGNTGSGMMASHMKQDATYPVEKVELTEGRTSPPGYLTESELISLMEKHGIGTDASIPGHIENICARNYVVVDSHSRTLQPTALGAALVHGYHRIDRELVLPKVRASIEQAITRIAKGEARYQDVVAHSLMVFKSKFDYFVANINLMDSLFQASFSKLTDMEVNTRVKPKCGLCNRYMKYINLKPHRLYCSTCEQVYNLPKSGSIKMSGTEFTCPLDSFELVVHVDPKGRAIYLCPQCYNNPTYPGMRPASTCVECPNTSCAHNAANFIVSPCTACGVGNLIFDQVNATRMDCDKCKYCILLPTNCNKMNVAKSSCPTCKAKLIHFKYNEKNTPMPGKLLEFDACVKCDAVMSGLMQIKGLVGPRGKPGRVQMRAAAVLQGAFAGALPNINSPAADEDGTDGPVPLRQAPRFDDFPPIEEVPRTFSGAGQHQASQQQQHQHQHHQQPKGDQGRKHSDKQTHGRNNQARRGSAKQSSAQPVGPAGSPDTARIVIGSEDERPEGSHRGGRGGRGRADRGRGGRANQSDTYQQHDQINARGRGRGGRGGGPAKNDVGAPVVPVAPSTEPIPMQTEQPQQQQRQRGQRNNHSQDRDKSSQRQEQKGVYRALTSTNDVSAQQTSAIAPEVQVPAATELKDPPARTQTAPRGQPSRGGRGKGPGAPKVVYKPKE